MEEVDIEADSRISNLLNILADGAMVKLVMRGNNGKSWSLVWAI